MASPLQLIKAINNFKYFECYVSNNYSKNILIVPSFIFVKTCLLLSINSTKVLSAKISHFDVESIIYKINKSSHYDAYNSFGLYSLIICLIKR